MHMHVGRKTAGVVALVISAATAPSQGAALSSTFRRAARRTLTPLSGTNDNRATNLQACIGECDSDSQCAPGLKCFQRSFYTPVPGCSGWGRYNWDYCYVPTTTTPNPTKYPTPNPTKYPTPNPTKYPTPNPTKYPTPNPTKYPTPNPTKYPTPNPTKYPTPSPTPLPTPPPTPPPPRSPAQSTSPANPERCDVRVPDFSFESRATFADRKRSARGGKSIGTGRKSCIRTVGQPDFDAKYVDAFAKEEMRKIAVESIMSSAGQYGVLVMAAVPFMPAPLKEFFEGPTDPEILNLQAQVDCLDGQLEALWAEMKATISREIGGLDDKIASDMAELNLISSISMITELSAVIEAEFIRPLSWCSQVVETGDGPATWAISDQTGACTDKSHYVGLSSLGTRLVTTTVSLRVKMKGAIDGLESIRRTISENQNKKDASREFHWGQLIESHRPAASFNNWPEPHVFLDRDDSPGAIGTDFTVARKLVRDFVALAEQALTAMKLLRATMSSRTVTAADELQHFEQLLRVNTERPLYQEVVDMLTYLKQTLNGIDRNGDDVALGRELRSDRFRPKMMCVDPTLAEEALLVDRASGTGGDFQRPGWCSGSAAAKNDRVYSMDRCPDYAKNCSNPANSAIRPKGAAVGDSCITPCATHPRVHGARWCFTDYQAGTDLDFEVLLSTSETSSIGVGNDIESRVSWGWCGPAKSTQIDSPAKGETQGSHNLATRWISQGKDISLFQCPMATGQDNWYQERLDEYCDSCIDWSRIEMSSVWSDYGEPDGVHGFGIENCKSREYSKWCGLNSLPQGVESGTHGECGLLGCPGDYNLALSRNMVWTGRGAAVDPLAIELALLDSALANAEGLLSHTFA